MAYYGDENRGGVNGHFYHVFGTVSFWRMNNCDLLVLMHPFSCSLCITRFLKVLCYKMFVSFRRIVVHDVLLPPAIVSYDGFCYMPLNKQGVLT